MEKKLTRDELLISLLKKAKNPFTTMEQKEDVHRILKESSTMRGMNHLFLVQCYFNESNPLFHVSRQEAIKQALLALEEKNKGSFYYLYLLRKEDDPIKARNYLRLACAFGNPLAYLELAKLEHKGILFEKNTKEAYRHYKIAASCGIKDAYFGMLLLASEEGNIALEKAIYEEAKKNHVILPGVIQ